MSPLWGLIVNVLSFYKDLTPDGANLLEKFCHSPAHESAPEGLNLCKKQYSSYKQTPAG